MTSANEAVDVIKDLDGGVFAQKIDRAFRDAAVNTVEYGGKKKGKVVLEFTFERIGDSTQVACAHKITSTVPLKRGKRIEEDETSTPLYVSAKGVSLIPHNQASLFETKTNTTTEEF